MVAKTRYYFLPELWYELGMPSMRFVRIGGPPDHWKFDRVRQLFPGLWRNFGKAWSDDHLQYRRVGE